MPHVSVKPSPFRYNDRKVMLFDEGTRLTEIINDTPIPHNLYGHVRVKIGDHEISRENWHRVKVKKDAPIFIDIFPHGGGGGGGKNPLKTVLSLAVLAAASFAAPAIGLAAFEAGVIGSIGGVISATPFIVGGLTILGNLALNALIPPSSPSSLSNLNNTQNASVSNTLSITGSSNKANKYGVVPRVYGRHRVYPALAAQPFTETVGNDQYLRMLFTFGKGPLDLSDLRIGETSISQFTEVETSIVYGDSPTEQVGLYTNSVSVDSYNVLVSNSGGSVTRTVSDNSDEFTVDFTFNGLVTVTDQGKYTNRSVVIKVEYKKVGDVTWIDNGNSTFTDSNPSTVRRSVRVDVSDDPGEYEVRLTRITGDTNSEKIFDECFLSGIRSVEYTNPTTLTGQCLVAIRIKATDQLNGVIDQFNAIAQAKLVTWDGAALTSAIATSNPAWAYLDVLRGSSTKQTIADSRIDLDLLKDWADDCDTVMEDGGVKYQFNGVFDYRTTVYQALNQISAAGRAKYGKTDGKEGVIRDVEQSVHRQMFTPRNSSNFKFIKNFVQKPDAVRVRYISELDDWQEAEVVVYDDGFNASNAETFDELELFGVTQQPQAWRQGRYYLAVNRLRPETIELTVDIENFPCTRGDLVAVNHDVPKWGLGYGRITAVNLSGSDAVSIEIDEPVPMSSANTYAVRMRLADNSQVLSTVNSGDGEFTTLTFTTPLSGSSIPAVGDLFTFGQSESETVDLVIKEIKPGEDLSATLVMLPYAPGVFTAEEGEIPAWTPQISTPDDVTPSPVAGFQAQEQNIPADRRYRNDAYLSWTMPNGEFAAGFEVYQLISGSFVLLDVTQNLFYRVENLTRGESYSFKVIAVSSGGRKIAVSDAVTRTISVQGQNPPRVNEFNIDIIQGTAHLNWSVNPSLVNGWRIKYSPTVDTNQTWSQLQDAITFVSYPTSSASLPARVGTYAIKSIDLDGFESDNPPTYATISAIENQFNVIENICESPDWLGTKDDTSVDVYGVKFPAGSLTLSGSELVSDWSLISNLSSIVAGDGGFVETGYYYFDNSIDLGDVYTSYVVADVEAVGTDVSNLVSSWVLVSSLDSITGTDSSEWGVTFEIRTTDDDPNGTPTWSSWRRLTASDVTARAIEFRIKLESSNMFVTPVVTKACVSVDMPDRIISDLNIVSDAGGSTVTFTDPFYTSSTPKVNITASNLSIGDYHEITSKTNTGFQIRFFNSSGTGISRTFDYFAAGYGKLVS